MAAFRSSNGGGRLSRRVWIVGLLILALFVTAIVWTFRSVPRANDASARVDAILVLGSPTEFDGSLTSAQIWRVDEAVREYRAGRAAHLLMSGGPTMHGHVEAEAMGAYARRLGVPPEAVLEEGASMTTIENIRSSERILKAHGWRRVEVISSGDHLPRAALLLQRTDLLWQTHAAPTPGRSRLQIAGAYAEEATGTAVIRYGGLWIWPVVHALAKAQGAVAFAFRWLYYKVGGWLSRR